MKIKSLDGLRGLAAICVFLGHIRQMSEVVIYVPYRFFEAGSSAVILFFVLSGYVLTYSHDKSNITYKQYCCRRIFRMYPAYYLSTLFSIILFFIIKPNKIDLYTPFFNEQFPSMIISTKVIIERLLLIVQDSNPINVVTWTLTHEVIISVIMLPILFKFKKIFNNYLIALVTIILCWQIGHFHNIYTITKSFKFFVFFYMGYLAFYNHHKLKYIASLKLLPLYLFLFASVYFTYGHSLSIDILAGLGSVGLISCCLYNKYFAKLLESRIVQFYGKISYSFYLFHMPILYLVVYTLRSRLSLWEIKVLIFIITTIISNFVYNNVELRFIKYGKKFFNPVR
jgi:peptidoglycan/LPS O-acetylase OafA/YrhL